VHVVAAVAVDTAGQTSPASAAAVTVSNPVVVEGVHIGDIDGVGATWYYWWAGVVTVTVHDSAERPVAGATVAVAWDGSVTQTCATATDGTCTLSRWFSRTVAATTVAVTGILVPGQAYVPGANHDPDASSDGTAITILSP
jgi:hypothetical protein